MQDRTGGDRMVCPRCGVEQASATECVHCGIVVARFKPHRPARTPPRAGLTVGAVFAVVLLAVAAWMLWNAVAPLEAEPPPVAALPTPPDVTHPADPTILDTRWARGAVGFRAAVTNQLDLRVPMVVYFHDRECTSCDRIQLELLNSGAFMAWLSDGLRVEVVVDDGPEDQALADKFGATTLPALWVVRSNGQRKPVPLTVGASGTLVDPATLVASLKEAAGR